jgi:hypothetical protein
LACVCEAALPLDGVQLPFLGQAAELRRATVVEAETRAATRSRTVLDTSTSPGAASLARKLRTPRTLTGHTTESQELYSVSSIRR